MPFCQVDCTYLGINTQLSMIAALLFPYNNLRLHKATLHRSWIIFENSKVEMGDNAVAKLTGRF